MKALNKKDIIFILAIVLLILLVNLAVNVFFKKNAQYLELSVNGEIINVYPLDEEKTVKIFEKEKVNNFEIKNGTVRMIEADCPDGTCMRQGQISKHNETIVCLPHKVVLRTVSKGDTKDSLDTVVK